MKKEVYLDLSTVSISQFCGISAVAGTMVSPVVNGHSGISVEMPLRLCKVLDAAPELWLDMQRDYDLWDIGKNIASGNQDY